MPEGQTVDLREQVPPGWALQGLSAPQWDGRNVYRSPTGPESQVQFTASDVRFVQFKYELQSPQEDVEGRVWLNGRLLDAFDFRVGQFGERLVAGFGQPGGNTLRVEYLCGSAPCRGVPIYQYWTQVSLLTPQRAREETGPGVQRWWLDGFQTPLTVSGTGPTLFDGANYFRPIRSPSFTLGWPGGARPLHVAFQINGRGPFEASARVNGQVVWSQRGDERAYVTSILSLAGRRDVREMDVRVSCAAGPGDCASLYFARVAVIPQEIGAERTPLWVAGALLLTLAALLGLAWWWCLLPAARRRPA